jgi:FkbM family methyltransferase
MPWSHRLPDLAAAVPAYGQNLVTLAVALGEFETPVSMVDVGANIGDSAVQVLSSTDARVLCVEADAYYMGFLETNVGGRPGCSIERALLSPNDLASSAMAPVRRGGTTRFEPGRSAETAPTITAGQLREQHPDFDRVRLIKSDTDGHDVVLIPSLAHAWRDHTPVLFFEFDPRLTRTAGHDAGRVWTELADLGYTQVSIWNNFGRPLERLSIEEAAAWFAARADDQPAKIYWDVAVAHGDDTAGQNAIANALVRSRVAEAP